MGTLLNLGNNLIKGGLGEDIGVILHIFLGVFVSLQKLEFEATKENGVTEEEVTLNVVVVANGVTVLLAFHKLTANATRVLIANLIYLNGVISAVEGNDETARFVIRLS